MFFKAIPTFNFSEENIKSHAYNVKKLSEWLYFKDCHLGLSHCAEITAIAFGFKTQQDLKLHLGKNSFCSLNISETITTDIEKALQKFCPPLKVLSQKESEEPYSESFFLKAFHKNDENKPLTTLEKVKIFWKDWHLKFALFLSKYFKEVHTKFNFFEPLNLISSGGIKDNGLALGNGADETSTFLSIAIYNHIFTQYVGDYTHHTIVCNQERVLIDNDISTRQYYISKNLRNYLSDNQNDIGFIKNNIYDSSKPLFLSYDDINQKAVMNLILCKNYMVDNYYIPTLTEFGINGLAKELRVLPFDIKNYSDNFSFELPFLFEDNWKYKSDKQIIFTEKDFKKALLSNSFFLQKLKGINSIQDITESTVSEFLFPLKWNDQQLFDVTENSFKIKDVCKVEYVFLKQVGTPFYASLDGKNHKLQPVYELKVTSHVFCTLEISIIDSNIEINIFDIKTKLSQTLNNTPVEVRYLLKDFEDGNYHIFDNSFLYLKISGLEKRASFKRMLDKHLFLPIYKQLIQMEDKVGIYRVHHSHLLSTLRELPKEI